jgi:iron complex transport system substrate-binding protein
MAFPPERIVCLTEETVETLYLLGEEARIAGVSGYAVRPPRVRKEKPRVSAFISADVPKILALAPDLVFTFSDLQADIVASLVGEGVEVHAFNQRSIAGILGMIRMVGAIVGKAEEGACLAAQLAAGVGLIKEDARRLPRHPRVYFEEWDEPMISGIGWVSEIVEAAGGIDVFPERAKAKGARDRIVTAGEVIAAAPDIILGSWCGKRFQPGRVSARAGFETIPAVRDGALYEIKSPVILQPGPAALTDGICAVAHIIQNWAVMSTSRDI